MTAQYSAAELMFYFVLYGFLCWMVQVVFTAWKAHRFVNTGFLNLPLSVSGGMGALILLEVLPTLEGHPVYQYILTLIVLFLVRKIKEQFLRNIRSGRGMAEPDTGNKQRLQERLEELLWAAGYLIVYLLVHPFLHLGVRWLPDVLVSALAIFLGIVTTADFLSVCYTFRTNRLTRGAVHRQERTKTIAQRITNRIWKRLEDAYPGLDADDPRTAEDLRFAQGMCFDKLVWVFVVSSFLGALIEMVYCYCVGAGWMNRSSVLYGAFSFVWGFGAVVLTVALQRLAGKADRKIFLAGFVIGGAYEYLCSVFTELVFGTVFWDYSHMPLNIGGRTNVLFCIFWGILSVVWIKILYPPMDRGIEKIPPLPGKVLTWILIFAMAANGILTSCAMLRYTQRQTEPAPGNGFEAFLDERYDDAWMEHRWPNMIITSE